MLYAVQAYTSLPKTQTHKIPGGTVQIYIPANDHTSTELMCLFDKLQAYGNFIHNATVKPWGTNLNTEGFIKQQMAG
jgi:hypothetical protein